MAQRCLLQVSRLCADSGRPRGAGIPPAGGPGRARLCRGSALAPIRSGGEVRKYGEVIGRAMGDIKAGEHVHNLESQRGRGDLATRV